MTTVSEVLIRYIDRLEEENKALSRRVKELTPNGAVSADIKKALHDASNLIGMEKKYKQTDPDRAAVEWIQEVVRLVDDIDNRVPQKAMKA